MKHCWILLAFLLYQGRVAYALTVSDVKVSVNAESAAAAREKALTEAHKVAFQKLLTEHFPENTSPPPGEEVLMGMVTDFSIDREKQTPTSYAAALTFQFDNGRVQEWLQNREAKSGAPSGPLQKGSKPLQIEASYASLAEWIKIKKALEHIPGVQKLEILAFSIKNATLDLTYGRDVIHLQQALQAENLVLSPQEKGWVLSSERSMAPLDVEHQRVRL